MRLQTILLPRSTSVHGRQLLQLCALALLADMVY